MNHIVATLLLISVTIVWGWSFVLVKDAIAIYGVMSFLTVRFIVAGLVMAPYSARRVTRSSLAVGIPIGLVLSAVFVTQTFGLQWTTATNSGLITGLFVVFAPMANRVMFGVRTRWLSWAAIAISFVGLALLTGSGPDRLNVGDLLTLVGAAFIGVFIALLDRYAKEHDAAGFAFVQIMVSTVCFLVVWPMIEPVRLPTGDVWFALLITGVISTAAGAIIQNHAQQHLPAVRVTVIIALTPLSAAVFGFVAAGDRLNAIQIGGAVLMIGAVMLVEVLGNNGKK
ncbi:MAG: DMT family transporter [Candidatus Nealsonbacteria bacterium]|nr:DMT family transporter [Candidatus Nealsonbacteria bacterium]